MDTQHCTIAHLLYWDRTKWELDYLVSHGNMFQHSIALINPNSMALIWMQIDRLIQSMYTAFSRVLEFADSDTPIKKLPLTRDRWTGAPQLGWNACSRCLAGKSWPLWSQQVIKLSTGLRQHCNRQTSRRCSLKTVKFTKLDAPVMKIHVQLSSIVKLIIETKPFFVSDCKHVYFCSKVSQLW